MNFKAHAYNGAYIWNKTYNKSFIIKSLFTNKYVSILEFSTFCIIIVNSIGSVKAFSKIDLSTSIILVNWFKNPGSMHLV